MAGSVLIEALGVPIVLELDGLADAEASAVRAAWRDAGAGAGSGAGSAAGSVAGSGAGSLGDPGFFGAKAADPSEEAGISEVIALRVREPGDTSDLPHLLERLSQRVTLAAIDARRGELWMLHAAGLAFPDGRVVVLVGPSGRGKTTASRTLGAQLGYVSDETVAMDAAGRVHPYRKPLSIIEGGVYPKAQRAPSDVGLGELPDASLTLAAIVLLDRQPDGPDEPVVSALDLGDALEELVAQSSYLVGLGQPLQLIASLLESTGGIHRVTYREADTLLPVVRALAATPSATDGSPIAGRVPPRNGGVARPSQPDEPLYCRVPVADAVWLTDPDRIAVLQLDEAGDGMFRVIAGIAPAIWDAADGATRDDLVAAAVAAHGAPEGADPAPLVDAAIADLVEAGLLRSGGPLWGIRDDVAWHDGGIRIVVLPLETPDADAHVLEGSAALIWRELAGADADLDTLVARVAARADIAPPAIADDVRAFLDGLAAAGLAAVTPAAAAPAP